MSKSMRLRLYVVTMPAYAVASAWALSQSGRRPRAEILETAARAGYDLSGLAGYLD